MLPASAFGFPSAPGGRPMIHSVHPSTLLWWLHQNGHIWSFHSPICSPAPSAAGQCCWFLWQTWWISPVEPVIHKESIDSGWSIIKEMNKTIILDEFNRLILTKQDLRDTERPSDPKAASSLLDRTREKHIPRDISPLLVSIWGREALIWLMSH